MNFSTTLLREKFTLKDGRSDEEAVKALSNRILLALPDATGRTIEKFVIRSQSMHSCIRMAAKIMQTYTRHGPLMARDEKFNYADAWDDIVRDYERHFHPECWVSVYNSGKRIFSSNEYHAFLDVIENCDHRNASGNYDTSVFLAEEIFASKGKTVTIEQDSNTGMVLDIRKDRARCGLILRSPVKRTNFTYMAEPKPAAENPLNVPQCMTIAASFLEGIQLGFFIGRVNELLRVQEISRYGEEDRKANAARKRLARINAEIKSFENNYSVTYRPDRPEFSQIIGETEKYVHKLWEASQPEKEEDPDEIYIE